MSVKKEISMNWLNLGTVMYFEPHFAQFKIMLGAKETYMSCISNIYLFFVLKVGLCRMENFRILDIRQKFVA